MRILVGVVVSGAAKAYAVAKFEEMVEEVFTDSHVDVVACVDEPGRTSLNEIVDSRMRGSPWATEIVYYGKETLGRLALEDNYDTLVWQGVDCYYKSRADFRMLLKGAKQYPILGALIAGRNRPSYAVCRRFVHGTTQQRDHIELREHRPFTAIRTVAGYVGSDATAISRSTLEQVTMDGYEHWHLRRDPYGLGPEEFFMWSAIHRNKIIPAMDPRIRPWHAHETGLCARYPDETCLLSDIAWG